MSKLFEPQNLPAGSEAAIRAHSTPDPDAPPPDRTPNQDPNPLPDDVPAPANAPVEEPFQPERPMKVS